MGRKKCNRLSVAPFCYYCEKECPDEKVLIQHQKARHFKCLECNKKLDTATGLVVHMIQVHKINLSKVPHAMEGRENPELSVHGMEGVPREMIERRRMDKAEKKGIKVLKNNHIVSAGQLGRGHNAQSPSPVCVGMMPPGAGPMMGGFMPPGVTFFPGMPPGMPMPPGLVMSMPPMGFGGPMPGMGGAPTPGRMNGAPPEVLSIRGASGGPAPAEGGSSMGETIKLAPTPPSGDLIYGVENISPDERRLLDMNRVAIHAI